MCHYPSLQVPVIVVVRRGLVHRAILVSGRAFGPGLAPGVFCVPLLAGRGDGVPPVSWTR